MGLLITELNHDVAGLIVESRTNGEKQYFIEGIFMQSEIKNRNGRQYARRMLEEEVERYVNEKVNLNCAIGELGHPATPALDHERASHLITALVQEGNDWIGKARVLAELPMGKVVRGLIREGVRFGVSSRGVGGLRKQPSGITEVHNFKIATAADVVTDPSTPGAWVNGIMEGESWVLDAAGSWIGSEIYESTIAELDKPTRLVTEQTRIRLFEQFLTGITTK